MERRQPERQLTDPFGAEALDRGHEAGLDGPGNGAREAPDEIEHPASIRTGGTHDHERDDRSIGSRGCRDRSVVQALLLELPDREAQWRTGRSSPDLVYRGHAMLERSAIWEIAEPAA